MTDGAPSASAPLTARVISVEAATPAVSVVRVAVDGPFEWRAGQFATVCFDGFEPRDYSIANRPDDAGLEFHIRNGGSGVGAHVATALASGDPLTVSGPFGASFYRRMHGGPLLAVAGGTGLAPMKAIVEDALATGHDKDVHLYLGVRDEPDIYMERHFLAMTREHPNFRFVTVLAEPSVNTGRRRGLVGDAVAADFALLYGYQCYVAGPPAMVQACRQVLKLKSVPLHDIFADLA